MWKTLLQLIKLTKTAYESNTKLRVKMGKKIWKKHEYIRCGTKNKHFACFALKMKCKIGSKVGHIAKASKANKTKSKRMYPSSSNYLQSRPEEKDASQFTSINTVRRYGSPCPSHVCMYSCIHCRGVNQKCLRLSNAAAPCNYVIIVSVL